MLIGKGTLDERVSVEAVRYNLDKVSLVLENITVSIHDKPQEVRVDMLLNEASDLAQALENSIEQQKERAQDAKDTERAAEAQARQTERQQERNPAEFSLHRLDPEHTIRGGKQAPSSDPSGTPSGTNPTGSGA